MHFNDIIDQITNIVILYYVEYRNKYNTKEHRMNVTNIIDKLHIYVKSSLISQYHRIYCEDFSYEIYSIDILDFPCEKNYHFGYMGDIDYTPLTNDVIGDIIYNLKSFIREHDYINNRTEIMSINVCPFDGLSIRHGEIMRLLDLYFY